MITHSLKRLPVVDSGRLVGWISRVDILRAIGQHQSLNEPLIYEAGNLPVDGRAITIADLMHRDVPVVSPQATLEEVLQALEQDRRRRAVVVDAEQQVPGIITDGDVLARSQHAAHPGLRGRLHALVTGQSSAAASAWTRSWSM